MFGEILDRAASDPKWASLRLEASIELASVLMGREETDQAQRVASQALVDAEADGLHRSAKAAVLMITLGGLAMDRGDFGEAEDWLRQALALQDSILGPEHSESLFTRSSLAMVLGNTNRLDEALPILFECVEVCRRRELRVDLASTLLHLSEQLLNAGRAAEVAEPVEEAIEVAEELYGEDCFLAVRGRENLGRAALARGRLGEAVAYFERALAAADASPDTPESIRLRIAIQCAECELFLGNKESARDIAREVLEESGLLEAESIPVDSGVTRRARWILEHRRE